MLSPYDWRVDDEQPRAVQICYELGLGPHDTNEDGIERWRVIAIDLAALRIKLRLLGVPL